MTSIMSTLAQTASLVGGSIVEMLREFIQWPFLNVREHDYQAVLFAKLRSRFPDPVPVRFNMNPSLAKAHLWKDPRTSRVHREGCLGKKGTSGYVNVDIVVFRDGLVTLNCHRDGPTAMQETVRIDELEAAIEIKNAPSLNGAEASKFAADVARLAHLQSQHPQLLCYAVVIDQAISLPGIAQGARDPRDWLSLVQGLDRHPQRPPGPHVEVCYVEPKSLSPGRAFFSRPGIVRHDGAGANDVTPHGGVNDR
jgi:hypothetical protein